jgi:CheY-like chemotaxis protein
MGGELEVESTVGQGARFTFDLPVELANEVDIQASRPSGRVVGLAGDRRDYRLLVAEDSAENRILLVTLLKSVGFHVREAVSGREAIEIWREWRPHLIWMDLRMPEMGGIRAIREIRKLSDGNETKIVALTAFAFEEDRERALEAGGDDYVRKPYTEMDIFHQLEKHLGVQFQYVERYAPSSGETSAESPDRQEIAAMLENLPEEMLSRLDKAIRTSDVAGTEKSIEQIGGIDPRLGRFLKKLADVYAYDEIVRCLDDDEEE